MRLIILFCVALISGCTTVELKDAGAIAVGAVEIADVFVDPIPTPEPTVLCQFATYPPTFGPCPIGVKP